MLRIAAVTVHDLSQIFCFLLPGSMFNGNECGAPSSVPLRGRKNHTFHVARAHIVLEQHDPSSRYESHVRWDKMAKKGQFIVEHGVRTEIIAGLDARRSQSAERG